MKHENTLCRVPRLLPEGRKGSLALWEGCTRWFRAVLWGPHPALRATFPSGARLFARPFCLLVRWGKAFWRVRFAYSSVEARLFARSFRLLVRWGKALLRVRFAYLSVEARLFARSFCLLVRWGKAFCASVLLTCPLGQGFLRVRFAYSSVGGKALGARGLRIPPTETLMVLADYYGVSMAYIMCRTKNPQMNQ